MVAFRIGQPLPNEFGFLLECMQHADSFLKPHDVDCAPRIAILGRYNLENATPAESFESLRRRIGYPFLCSVNRVAEKQYGAVYQLRRSGELAGSPSLIPT